MASASSAIDSDPIGALGIIINYYYRGKENRSLYGGLRYTEVRYIEVSLYLFLYKSIVTFGSWRFSWPFAFTIWKYFQL